MTMDFTNDKSSGQPAPIPWARLRAWIDDKEAWEKQHQRPAPLSSKELAAISSLVPFIEEPDVGDTNYIGNLMNFVQTKHLKPPLFTEESVNTSVGGVNQLLWRGFWQLDEGSGKFPREGFGYSSGEPCPAFQNKKKAKQFAAQQTLKYLETLGSASSSQPAPSSSQPAPKAAISHSTAVPPAPSTPTGKRLKVDHGDSVSPSLFRRETPSPAQRKSSSTPLGGSDRSPSIFECVRSVAEQIGLENPRYETKPEQVLPNLWCGKAYFNPGSKVPDDLGLVRCVLSRSEAKVQVAQKVLVWLEQEKQRRQDDLDFLRNKRLS